MVEILKVETKKQIREFCDFPNRLYKDSEYYVPPFYGDELALFKKDSINKLSCEYIFFLAVKDKKTVGRIGGILQKASNKKRNEKRIRFTRFDSINDFEVAKALFDAVENWGKNLGMDTICGPLGFNDLEREGLLIEGFDYLSTYEEQYNYEYYKDLIEKCGYEKEVDWIEHRLFKSEEYDPKFFQVATRILEKYNFKITDVKDTNVFLDRYGDKFFDLLDKTYADLYQTVPFNEEEKKSMIKSFKLILDVNTTNVIVDENDNVICLGVSFPSLSRALLKSGGHLWPHVIIKLLHDIKHPKIYDFGLIGVEPKYAQKGVASYLIAAVYDRLNKEGVEYMETNLNLEDNYNIINQWKRFNCIQHKRRRAFIKKIV